MGWHNLSAQWQDAILILMSLSPVIIGLAGSLLFYKPILAVRALILGHPKFHVGFVLMFGSVCCHWCGRAESRACKYDRELRRLPVLLT
jgi:hypothetical protein